MARRRVAILSGHSLFTEGVASRLRQHSEEIDLHTIDARQSSALSDMIALQPSTIILDATDPEVEQLCPLNRVLEALPSLKVIRLDPQQDHIQVVTSEQRIAADISELISLIAA
jgi:DNA-binding NarL/FixJ family response regulator